MRFSVRIPNLLIPLLFIAVCLFMTYPTFGQASRINIYAVGDSITWGQAFGSGHDYPSQLRKKFTDRGLDVRVTNHGISGYTVGDILDEWKKPSKARIFARMDVHFVLIMLGTNDTRVGDETPTDTYVERMNELVDLFLKVENSDGSHPQVILSLIPPHNSPKDGENMASNFKDRFIHRDRIPGELNPELIKIAQEKSLMLVDNYSPLKAMGPDILPDGLHPAQEGNTILAETWYNALLPLVDPTACVDKCIYELMK